MNTMKVLRKVSKKDIGRDIVIPRGRWGEIAEVLSDTQILIEYPDKTREIYNLEVQQ
jgi:hypothetical protein